MRQKSPLRQSKPKPSRARPPPPEPDDNRARSRAEVGILLSERGGPHTHTVAFRQVVGLLAFTVPALVTAGERRLAELETSVFARRTYVPPSTGTSLPLLAAPWLATAEQPCPHDHAGSAVGARTTDIRTRVRLIETTRNGRHADRNWVRHTARCARQLRALGAVRISWAHAHAGTAVAATQTRSGFAHASQWGSAVRDGHARIAVFAITCGSALGRELAATLFCDDLAGRRGRRRSGTGSDAPIARGPQLASRAGTRARLATP